MTDFCSTTTTRIGVGLPMLDYIVFIYACNSGEEAHDVAHGVRPPKLSHMAVESNESTTNTGPTVGTILESRSSNAAVGMLTLSDKLSLFTQEKVRRRL